MLANLPHRKQPAAEASPTAEAGASPLRLVFCIALSRGRADSILVDLMDDGIASSDIVVLFRDPDRSVEAPVPGIAVPASSGAIRGVMASLDGARRVVMPDVGPVVMSGILSALAGAEICPGLSQLFQRLGVPLAEATRFVGRIAAGHFFIAVRTSYPGTSDRAGEIFMANKADEVCTKMDIVRPTTGTVVGVINWRKGNP